MNEMERSTVLLGLIEEMKSQGSWCGETHIQKATFFLQDLLRVPLDFDFILYKYGPFSFELKDHITAMRADGFVRVIPQFPYGPSIVTDEKGEKLLSKFGNEIENYSKKNEFVAGVIGSKDATELEALATAYYVSKGNNKKEIRERAKILQEYKPHVNDETAHRVIAEVDTIIKLAKERSLI